MALGGAGSASRAMLLAVLLVPASSFAAASLAPDPLPGVKDQTVVAIASHVVHAEAAEAGTGGESIQAAHDIFDDGCTHYDPERRINATGALWFNDAFLFGELSVEVGEGDDCEEGEEPDGSSARTVETRDPYGTVVGTVGDCPNCTPPEGFVLAYDARIDEDDMHELVRADRVCKGCVFDYNRSFHITDPNGFGWIVDELERASSDVPEHCLEIGCEDGTPHEGPVNQPLYVVRQQQDPITGEAPQDQVPFLCPPDWDEDQGTIREGAPAEPYPCEEQDSVRYSYLLTPDMEAFTENAWTNEPVEYGLGGADAAEPATAGNSHRHNPEIEERAPEHFHPGIKLRISFVAEGPSFAEANPHWGTDGEPPVLTEDCSSVAEPVGEERQAAVQARDFQLCDGTADEGMHLHDGSQSPGCEQWFDWCY